MKDTCRQIGRVAALMAVAGLALVAAPARAQTPPDPRPQWMKDSFNISNKYLQIWEYFQGAHVTKFDVWDELGDPENQTDDFGGFPLDPRPNVFMYIRPWAIGASRLLSSPHPPNGTNADAEVWANTVTVRVDDPAAKNTTTFRDLTFPSGGTAVFAPPIVSLSRGQGFYAPYRFESNTLIITQKVQFARDLVRIEYVVQNIGGTARRVGIRLLLDPYTDHYGPTRSVFDPRTRERFFYETDFGNRTGTTTRPRHARIPESWELYSDDEGPFQAQVSKGYLRDDDTRVLTNTNVTGATTPTRVVYANTLNLFPTEGTWDYDVDFPQELRISDIGHLIYWDPVQVAAGKSISFVTYAGQGVASHVMSNAYRTYASQPVTPAPNNTFKVDTVGYIGAVQAPFAMPLIDGNADLSSVGTALTSNVTAYMQSEYHSASIPNAFAFLTLPDGLQLANTGDSQRLDLGNVDAIGNVNDEAQGRWAIQANGIRAGLLDISVTFSSQFRDSSSVIRQINVPQGRLYQLGDDWRMKTFPFNYDAQQDDPTQVLGLPAGNFQIVQYNPQTNQYEPVTRVVAGRGYWVRMLGTGTQFVRLQNAAPLNLALDQTKSVTVLRGWNQVGNPSPYAVPVRNLQFLIEGGTFATFEEAVSRGLIRAALYEFDETLGQYRQLGPDDLINPGRGIWIYANSERDILFPAPQGPSLSITP
jgi:hypothetical protein